MRTSRFLWLGAVALLAAALVGSVPVAGARPRPPQPLIVRRTSLTQSGQDVIWSVTLTAPFSPRGLGLGKRSLCLLIERPRSAALTGQLCAIGPWPGGKHPRLVYAPVAHATVQTGHVITATVRHSTSRNLTATFLPSAVGTGYTPIRWQVRNTLRIPPCVSVNAKRPRCIRLYPRPPALALLHTPQVVGCVPSGVPFVNQGPASGRMIAFTFDDGPWPDTPQFLDVLEHYHVPATFFEIGDQVGEYGQGGAIQRRMLADGDMIGDHTWNHADVAGGGAFASGEISQAAAAIKSATHGFEPCLFRAPYGATSPGLISVAQSLGFKTIQWDIDPRDWARPGTGAIYGNVVANAHPGAIILQHDGGGDRSETLAALPQEIQTLRARGYHFVTITQLFGMRLLYR